MIPSRRLHHYIVRARRTLSGGTCVCATACHAKRRPARRQRETRLSLRTSGTKESGVMISLRVEQALPRVARLADVLPCVLLKECSKHPMMRGGRAMPTGTATGATPIDRAVVSCLQQTKPERLDSRQENNCMNLRFLQIPRNAASHSREGGAAGVV